MQLSFYPSPLSCRFKSCTILILNQFSKIIIVIKKAAEIPEIDPSQTSKRTTEKKR